MGQIVLIVLAAILVLALVVLVAPVRVRLSFAPGIAWVRVRYLGFFTEYDVITGVVTRGILGRVISRRAPGPPEPARPRKAKPRKPPEEGKGLREKGRIIWSFRVVLRRAFLVGVRLVGRILRSWQLETADIALTLGLSNPAHTGVATGLFHAMRPGLRQRYPRVHLWFYPEFREAVMQAEGDIVLRLIPMQPVVHLLRALGTLPWRGLWKFKKAWTS